MGDMEDPAGERQQPGALGLLLNKDFIASRKGKLLAAEVVLTFITFVCFVASSAAVFTTAPLVEFLMAIFFYFAYSTKFNERFKDFYWPLVDFLRCVTASIIYFIISIISVSKYSGGASSAAGVFGFIATIVFAIDFYFIFNDLATFLKQGRTPDEEPQAANDSDSDSD
ncbi:CKLF-like MARVEL transmembrane domain-containing protein 3 isoform X2 [Paramormyrops kingsleyae]|uniref:CKLF-like MARVEL transmembrane domain-containing protein 3 isoform X2 n=1 Tax=Paramormyrops kingsleyae TaxID=1676925 RepID=UPI003B96C4A8